MPANKEKSTPNSSAKLQARLKVVGVVVLVLGLAGAGVVYWLGTRTPDVADDISMVGYNRAETRQMSQLFGKSGQMVEDLSNALKQPGTQAMLIVIAVAAVSAGCFYFAGLLKDHDAPAGD